VWFVSQSQAAAKSAYEEAAALLQDATVVDHMFRDLEKVREQVTSLEVPMSTADGENLDSVLAELREDEKHLSEAQARVAALRDRQLADRVRRRRSHSHPRCPWLCYAIVALHLPALLSSRCCRRRSLSCSPQRSAPRSRSRS
jgi:cell division FtsZ-interacting protein ZapD